MPAILERLAEWAEEKEYTLRNMRGNDFTQRQLDEMLPLIAQSIKTVDFGEDRQTYKGVTLMCLGEAPYGKARFGLVSCTRAVYVGEDAKVYIEGPRRKMGSVVIDIHPYCVDDAADWGIRARTIADMAAACFI